MPKPFDHLIAAARQHATSDGERCLLAHGALPIPWAWEGHFGVTAEGKVLASNDQGELEAPLVFDTRATLGYCLKTYPELSYLLPRRPQAAPDCPDCQGKGGFEVGNHQLQCGTCFGFGWKAFSCQHCFKREPTAELSAMQRRLYGFYHLRQPPCQVCTVCESEITTTNRLNIYTTTLAGAVSQIIVHWLKH